MLREALDGGPGAPRVVVLAGPAGVGTSALLRRCAEDARALGRPVLWIDARSVEPTPAALAKAFAREAAAAGAGRAVLLVDSAETLTGLEPWLRERFLPSLAPGTTTVLATRHVPSLAWRADPAWRGALRVVTVTDLSADEARELLAERGVPAGLHQDVLAFTGGSPLALAAAAEEVLRQPPRSGRWTPSAELLDALLEHVVGELPSPAHRRALEVAAHVLDTTEDLLREVLGDEAPELFTWLRRQPFVEAGPQGLHPHELVRRLVETDLRWRDRQGWEAMHRRIRACLATRALGARGASTRTAAAGLNFLHRNAELPARFLTWRGRGEVAEEPYGAADREALLALAREATDEGTTRLVDLWLRRRPQDAVVHRDTTSGQVVGFLVHLVLAARDEEEVRADPVVAAVWEHVERTGPLRCGEHLRIVRFVVQAGGDPRPSPFSDLVIARCLAEYLHDDDLGWSFVVLRNAGFWEPLLSYLDHPRLDGPLAGAFAHDWRAVPREAWLRLCGERLVHGPEVSAGAPDDAVLPRTRFDEAVRDVLRTWHDDTALVGSPLMSTRLAGAGTPQERLATLRSAVLDAARGLCGPRLGRYGTVLTTTYLDSRPRTQEAAAARLSTPFSTYRRHLAAGVRELTDALWRQETGRGG
ncbi:ATP-binding protein [Kineococcus sp. NUM-3379]